MRKLCSILLSMVLILSVFTGVAAKSQQAPSNGMSEYDMLKEYDGKTREELLQLGLEQSAIDELFNLQEIIKEYRTYSSSKLKSLGFSQEQIYYLKKPQPTMSRSLSMSRSASFSSEAESIFEVEPFEKGLFAKVKFNIQKSGGDEYHYFTVYWEWTGRPFIRKTDGVIVNWDGDREMSFGHHYIIYVTPQLMADTMIYTVTDDENILKTKTKGLGLTFETDRDNFREYLKKGELSFKLTKLENDEEITLICRYAHTTLTKEVKLILDEEGYVDVDNDSTIQTLYKQTYKKGDYNF